MSASDDTTIGLFPLQLVLVPGEIVPLHIFEERYKRLIGDCRRDDVPFGIVLRDEDGVAECGCTATVYQVLDEFDDGRLNVLVEGGERFRVSEVVQPDDPDDDYLRARVTAFSDDEDGDVTAIAAEAGQLFLQLVALMGAEEPKLPEGPSPLSFRLAAAVDFGAPLKQRVLESVSEVDRLDLLATVMRSLIPSLELRQERAEAIRGNGKGN
jgi:Lon protease-like protein